VKRRLLYAIDLYRSLPNRPPCPRVGASCSEVARRRVSRYGAVIGAFTAYWVVSSCKCMPDTDGWGQ
jgi:putative component of membrane protein insertase Oxa1/YidC/SpoIIIJ protein YidD